MFSKNKYIQSKLYIFFLFVVLFFITFSTSNVFANSYKILDLEISEPYELNFNKQDVIYKAFKLAFAELTARITISDDKKNLKDVKLKEIKSLVNSFTIVDEKFIDNKYFAKFDVDFNKKEVLNYLEKKNIFPSIPIEKKLFVIPILIDFDSNQVLLFSENPFYLTWNEKNEKYYLLKYILPNEDLEDINIIKKNIDKIEDYNFNEIIKKYDLQDYIIIIFFKKKRNLRTFSKVNLNNQLIISNEIFSDINFNDNQSIENVIKILKTSYENQWKKINQINTSIKLPITLALESKNYDLIINFEKKLSDLDLISNYFIENFSNEITVYKIIYNSTPDKFINEIESSGFTINTSHNIWRIQ